MPPSGISPESLLQLYPTLLLWIAWIFIGFAWLAGVTSLVFVWRECFCSAIRQPVLPRSMDCPAPHPPPETVRPRFALLPLIRIVLTAHRRAAPVTAEANDERE